jgi:LysM domain
MSMMSTGQASAGAAVGAEFMVPGPWPTGSASCGTAGLAVAGGAGACGCGCGCQQPGAGGQGESGLRRTELHFRELRVRELHVRELNIRHARAGGRDAAPHGTGTARAYHAWLREIRVHPSAPRPPQVRAAASRPAPLRLTRRGRAVVAVLTVLAAAAVVTLLWLAAAGGAQAASHGQPAGAGFQGMTRVVVRPGQTLWSIAASAQPSANPWAVIQQITDANALSGTSVHAGQLLWVPQG